MDKFLLSVQNTENKKPRRRFFFKGMVFSSFNIQYQRTGVGPLSSLDEIDPDEVYWSYLKCIGFDITVVQQNNFIGVVFFFFDTSYCYYT